jgi:hypothetical protein
VLTVTHHHRLVLGVSATVVADRLYLNGRLAERTTDWYAQDKSRNVWYLGRQEYYKGHAEDQFRVLSLGARVRTPAVSSRRALLTQETTRLEPGAIDHKLYVRGVGTVVERAVRGGSERFVLARIERP